MFSTKESIIMSLSVYFCIYTIEYLNVIIGEMMNCVFIIITFII